MVKPKPYPSFEFESTQLSSPNAETFALIRVEYDPKCDPAELIHMEDVDSGDEYKLLDLPADDVHYIELRLKELGDEESKNGPRHR